MGKAVPIFTPVASRFAEESGRVPQQSRQRGTIPLRGPALFPVLPRRGEVLPPCGSPAPSDRLTVAQSSLILFSYLPGKSQATPAFQTPASSPGRDFSGSPCLGFA